MGATSEKTAAALLSTGCFFSHLPEYSKSIMANDLHIEPVEMAYGRQP
jgi:hypothetical protein